MAPASTRDQELIDEATATQAARPSVAPTQAAVLFATAIPANTAARSAPPASPALAAASATATPTGPSASGYVPVKLDMDAIFPQGDGRELVLFNCTACHSFVRIVMGQRTLDRWEIVKRNHRPRVPQVPDSDLNRIFAYAETHFNETKPIPSLPDWMLEADSW